MQRMIPVIGRYPFPIEHSPNHFSRVDPNVAFVRIVLFVTKQKRRPLAIAVCQLWTDRQTCIQLCLLLFCCQENRSDQNSNSLFSFLNSIDIIFSKMSLREMMTYCKPFTSQIVLTLWLKKMSYIMYKKVNTDWMYKHKLKSRDHRNCWSLIVNIMAAIGMPPQGARQEHQQSEYWFSWHRTFCFQFHWKFLRQVSLICVWKLIF